MCKQYYVKLRNFLSITTCLRGGPSHLINYKPLYHLGKEKREVDTSKQVTNCIFPQVCTFGEFDHLKGLVHSCDVYITKVAVFVLVVKPYLLEETPCRFLSVKLEFHLEDDFNCFWPQLIEWYLWSFISIPFYEFENIQNLRILLHLQFYRSPTRQYIAFFSMKVLNIDTIANFHLTIVFFKLCYIPFEGFVNFVFGLKFLWMKVSFHVIQ